MKKLLLALFVVGLCLSGASDVNAYYVDEGVPVQRAESGDNCNSTSIATTSTYIHTAGPGSHLSTCHKGIFWDDVDAGTVTTITVVASTTAVFTGGTLSSGSCRIRMGTWNGSAITWLASGVSVVSWSVNPSAGSSSGRATTTLSGVTNFVPTAEVAWGDTDVNCITDIVSILYDGVEVLSTIPPSQTTPTPTNGFTETFDTASTTAGTALKDTWGTIGWVQPSAGSGSYTVTATGTAPSSPNVASPSGTKSVGFYVATSTKIYYESEIFMGTNTDFSFNIWQNGVVGSSMSGTDQLSVNLCTRSSCGLGVPQITISSVGSLFSCTLLQATSTYTGDSWTDFKLLFDADNGTVDVYVGTTRFSTICNNSFTIASPIVEISPTASIDNVYVALDGDAPVLPTDPLAPPPDFGIIYLPNVGEYDTRFTDIEVATVGTTTSVTLDYYLDPEEYDPTYPFKDPQTIRLQLYYSTSTSNEPQIPRSAEYTRSPTSTGDVTQVIPLNIWGTPLPQGNYELSASFSNALCFFGRPNGIFNDCPFFGIGVQIAFTVDGAGAITVVNEAFTDDHNEGEFDNLDDTFFAQLIGPVNTVMYQKHPTAWIFQFLYILKEASEREQLEATTTIQLPFFYGLDHIEEDTWLSAGLEFGKETVGDLSKPIPFTIVEDGCRAFDDMVFQDENEEEIISCTTFRSFIAAAIWIGFVVFCLILTRQIFKFNKADWAGEGFM